MRQGNLYENRHIQVKFHTVSEHPQQAGIQQEGLQVD